MLAFANGSTLSDLDIVARYNMKRKTVSARRCELWRHGFVEPIGMKKMGRQRVQIWTATLAGRVEINRLAAMEFQDPDEVDYDDVDTDGEEYA
jgi:hypothetical protein